MSTGMSNSNSASARPRIRYGLRALLVLLLVFAAVGGAYRYGYQQGRADGPVIPPNLDYHHIYEREYDVSDLVPTTSAAGNAPDDLTALTKHVTTWAAPQGQRTKIWT